MPTRIDAAMRNTLQATMKTDAPRNASRRRCAAPFTRNAAIAPKARTAAMAEHDGLMVARNGRCGPGDTRIWLP